MTSLLLLGCHRIAVWHKHHIFLVIWDKEWNRQLQHSFFPLVAKPGLCFYVNFDVQVKCMEIKRADHGAALLQGSILKDGHSMPLSSAGLCYSVEIKDSHSPPWIISNICALMASDGRSFEARYNILSFPQIKLLHSIWFLNMYVGSFKCNLNGSSFCKWIC